MQHSETAEDAKKVKNQVQNNHNHNIIYKYSLKYHNIGFILILNGLKALLLQGILIISKGYTLKIFEVTRIRIDFHFMFQLDVKLLQVLFNLSQTPLSWPTSTMTKTVVASVV